MQFRLHPPRAGVTSSDKLGLCGGALNQHVTTVDDDDLSGAKTLLHQIRIRLQLVASFSRSSNLSVIGAGTGFVIGEGRSVRVQMFGLIE